MWYVNLTRVKNIDFAIDSFILTMWYVNNGNITGWKYNSRVLY